MSLSDEEFRELYKPIPVPAHYGAEETDFNKVLYALGQIGEGTVETVCSFLAQTDNRIDKRKYVPVASTILQGLFDSGRIAGSKISGQMHYNLSKITHENEGSVNPDLLAPGLD